MKTYKEQANELIEKRKEFLKSQVGKDIILLPHGRTLVDGKIQTLIQAGEYFIYELDDEICYENCQCMSCQRLIPKVVEIKESIAKLKEVIK